MMTLERALTSGRYSPAVTEKARRLYIAGGVRPDPDYPDVFWVKSGSEAGREYRCQLHEHFASCSCAHGLNTGAGSHCAHPLAAMTYRKMNGLEEPQASEADFEEPEDAALSRTVIRTDPDAEGPLPDEPFLWRTRGEGPARCAGAGST